MGLFGELTSRAVSSGNTTKKLETDETKKDSEVVTNPFDRKLSENKAQRRAFAQQGAMFKLNKVYNDLPEDATREFKLD